MVWTFTAAYIAVWFGYAALAAVGQLALSRAALLTPMVQSASLLLSVVILLAAGLFQFTSLKEACLTKCRSPLGFFITEWRDGAIGAFIMGLKLGSFCVICCSALMALMFVVGAMNLLWMVMLTVFMLAEKLSPARWQISRISAVVFVLWGALIATGVID
jgi:predicted metal-binding membrane protein